MSEIPQGSETSSKPEAAAATPAAVASSKPPVGKHMHEVTFVTYPKLLFVWPVILAGYIFYPLGAPPAPSPTEAVSVQAGEAAPVAPTASARLEYLGWVYLWTVVLVLLTLGVDIDRNKAAFWLILVVAIYVLGLWLHDVRGFTLFGDIFRWFCWLDVQFDRGLALAISIVLSVPYVIMLLWARINDRWRITHNEFEHYSFGKMDDSLGRGAKTIRADYPDVFELLLGLAGTLIVYNASGTRELRRIPHVMFLPFVRKRLNTILEKTAITMGALEEEEEEEAGV